MDTLSKLFGGAAKVKMLKLFIFNPDEAFDTTYIADRTKESLGKVRRELSLLHKAGFIKKRTFFKTIENGRGGKPTKRKTNGWTLDRKFVYLAPLRSFLISMNQFGPKHIASKLQRSGNMKLIIVSGVFIQEPDSRVDLLIVGDHLKKNVLDNAIRTIEAEMGKEIRYDVFETPDFQYRYGLYDKLIRDILDFPHKKMLDRIGIS